MKTGWTLTVEDSRNVSYLLLTEFGCSFWFENFVYACDYIRNYHLTYNSTNLEAPRTIPNLKTMLWAQAVNLKITETQLHEVRMAASIPFELKRLVSKHGICYGTPLSMSGDYCLRDPDKARAPHFPWRSR